MSKYYCGNYFEVGLTCQCKSFRGECLGSRLCPYRCSFEEYVSKELREIRADTNTINEISENYNRIKHTVDSISHYFICAGNTNKANTYKRKCRRHINVVAHEKKRVI